MGYKLLVYFLLLIVGVSTNLFSSDFTNNEISNGPVRVVCVDNNGDFPLHDPANWIATANDDIVPFGGSSTICGGINPHSFIFSENKDFSIYFISGSTDFTSIPTAPSYNNLFLFTPGKCAPFFTGMPELGKFEVDSSLLGTFYPLVNTYVPDAVENGYYMRTFSFTHVVGPTPTPVFDEYILPKTNGTYTYNFNNFNNSAGSTTGNLMATLGGHYITAFDMYKIGNHLPFVHLTPTFPEHIYYEIDELKLKLTNLCNNNNSYCGKYDLKTYLTPIDGKCDFDNNFDLDYTIPFAPENEIEVHDFSWNLEICPLGQEWTGTKCDFPTKLEVVDIKKEDKYFFNCKILDNGDLFVLADHDAGDNQIKLYKDSIPINSFGPLPVPIPAADFTVSPASSGIYEVERIDIFNVPHNIGSCIVKQIPTFNETQLFFDDDFIDYYKADINRTDNMFIINENKTVFYKKDSGTLLPIPQISSKTNNTVIYNNIYGVSRNTTVDTAEVAVHLHKIKNLRNETAVDELNNTINLMSNYNITVDTKPMITVNSKDGIAYYEDYDWTLKTVDNSKPELATRTQIKITINGTPNTNFAIFHISTKDVAYSASQLVFGNDGGGQRFIQDIDPIIGWYFNSSTTNSSINFSVPGNSTGGSVIISGMPVLFNEGNLTINYRQVDCYPDEAHLFELDSLENSSVYTRNSGRLYKVCMSYLGENLSHERINQFVHIFNFSNGGNMSFNGSLGLESAQVSINKANLFWDIRVQENNPDGTYSCIGSFNDEGNSSFGDCLYNSTNRIWIHLGEDFIAPHIYELSYPYVSHTMNPTIKAQDNIGGSGVKEIQYCVDSTNTCDPLTDPSAVTVSGNEATLTITCPNDWGCLRYLRAISIDYAGNIEVPVRSLPVKMIDKGSSCKSSCMGVPTPNRYLKECRNLNGCFYYPFNSTGDYDDGLEVSQKCDMMLEDSIINFNSTHDMVCPNGPFTQSRFTDLIVKFQTETCNHVKTTPYNVIVDGELIIMKVISCIKLI